MISQKVCVVTGASSGVGAEAAETFAKAGIKVVLSARREDRLKELVEKIVAAGGEAVYKVTDVTKDSEVQALFDFAVETYGGVDYVFANAGYNGNVLKPLTEKTEDEVVQILMINTAGAIYTLKSAVPVLKQRGGGAIVFTSSILAHSNYKSQGVLAAAGFAGGGALVYSASKAAVDTISRSAGQFAGDGIRSYSLQIGAFDTEMSRNSAEQLSQAIGQEVPVEAFGASNPICDTLGKADEVGKVALALFDGTSAWKPGQTIVVDNDLTADAAAWTCALDAPLDTDSGLPTKEQAREIARDIKGNVPHMGVDEEERERTAGNEKQPLQLSPKQLGSAIPTILHIGQQHFVGQCLHVMIKAGIPDIIGNGKLSLGDIAAGCTDGVNEEHLGRCLRILAISGVVEESSGPEGEFVYGLTPAGALLQTKAAQPSMACGVRHWMEKPMWDSWSRVPDLVMNKIDKPAFEEQNGNHLFQFYDENPESAAPFNEFMTFFSQGELPVVVGAEIWKTLSGKTVVDVGGSHGTVMGAVHAAHPDVECISFDLEKVIDDAGDPPEGVTFAKGDMFEPDTIPKGDVIFMKHILHDWSDDNSVKILTSCHQALPDEGRVIVCDAVLPVAGNLTPEVAPGVFLDTLMMLIGGKERTQAQWEDLAAKSGFRVAEVVGGHPTANLVILDKA